MSVLVAASVPAPLLGLHVHLGFRGEALVSCRFAREPLAAPSPALEGGAAEAVACVARHLRTGAEDLGGIRVDLSAVSPFQRRALEAIREIPPGSTWTYGEVARRLGERPAAARAVGGAMAANPVPLVVPCHRVVPADGAPFRNYSGLGGVATKRALLRLERAVAQEGLGSFGAVADVQ